MSSLVKTVIEKYSRDRTRLMDILIDIQSVEGYISPNSIVKISEELQMSEVDVEQTLSFYHFFSLKPTGKFSVFLNDSVVAVMMGRKEVADAFEEAAGIKFGEVSADGLIGLYNTACIGMNDQEPAAIINNRVFTRLTPFRVKEIVRDIRAGKAIDDMFSASFGDGGNRSKWVRSVVSNNIRKTGPILDPNYIAGEALKKAITLSPEHLIQEIKNSNMRGRGGAGFPTGLKWELCRNASNGKKYIFCNADEGEPGTFKDRVILTEMPHMLFEGMAAAAYAVGADEGIIYIRYEYKYLEEYLSEILQVARDNNFLGDSILGVKDFNFDIRIQYGAGAYVCGEESALIESAEGKRGEPRDRPPFPVEKGYLDKPTVVNNVETLCAVCKIIINGGEWYRSLGTSESTGTKVLSISGDCRYPGVYDLEWGFSVKDVLDMVGASAKEIQAVQVGGPSGSLIGSSEFNRILGYEDLATGGSLIIFDYTRDLLIDVVLNFTNFFIDESCGSCSTCRIIPTVLKNKLQKILNGRGLAQDIIDLEEWGQTLKASRCGLGQTAANPILTSIKNFRSLYEDRIQTQREFDSGFNLEHAIADASKITGRVLNLKNSKL